MIVIMLSYILHLPLIRNMESEGTEGNLHSRWHDSVQM